MAVYRAIDAVKKRTQRSRKYNGLVDDVNESAALPHFQAGVLAGFGKAVEKVELLAGGRCAFFCFDVKAIGV